MKRLCIILVGVMFFVASCEKGVPVKEELNEVFGIPENDSLSIFHIDVEKAVSISENFQSQFDIQAGKMLDLG